MRWFHSFCGISPVTGKQRVFFVEYLIMNPSLGGDQPILGQLPSNRRQGIRPSYLRMKAGTFASDSDSSVELHSYYPLTELKVAFHPFLIKFGENFYSEQHIHGKVRVSHQDARRKSHMTDEGVMTWDLKVHKSIACHTGKFSDPVHSAMSAADAFWHAEGIKTQYSGTVTLDGELYEVTPSESCGYADKHWGSRFPSPWLQLSSCCLLSERTGRQLKHSAFAADGCSSRFLWFHPRRRLMVQLTYEGEDFEFNFSPFGKNCKWNVKRTNKRFIWQIVAADKDAVIKVTVSHFLQNMSKLRYEDPNGDLSCDPYAGSCGCGKILLYRRITKDSSAGLYAENDIPASGKVLIDTLTLRNVLTVYRPQDHDSKA